MNGAGEPGQLAGGDKLRVEAFAQVRQRRHYTLRIHHDGLDYARGYHVLLERESRGKRHAQRRKEGSPGAADPDQVHVRVPGGFLGYRLHAQGLMPVRGDVHFPGVQAAQVELPLSGLRSAQVPVLQRGGQRKPAEPVQRGKFEGPPQHLLRVSAHAMEDRRRASEISRNCEPAPPAGVWPRGAAPPVKSSICCACPQWAAAQDCRGKPYAACAFPDYRRGRRFAKF